MSNFQIVRVNDKLIPEFLILYDQEKNIAHFSNISSWNDIEKKSKDKLVLLLSANLVFSTQVNIPSKNDEIIRQSLPFTIEEELATDLEQNHFAYKKTTNQDLLVSVIDKNLLQNILDQIDKHELACHAIYSEIFSCPHKSGMTSMCAVKDYIIIRDDKNGTTIDSQLLNQYLKLSANTQKVMFFQTGSEVVSLKNVINKSTNMAQLQAQTICTDEGVNLLQGEFSLNQSETKTTHPLKKLGILLAILLLSWLITSLFDIWKLTKNIETLKNAQVSLLTKIIPNVSQTELNDPYSAMLSRLQLNQNSQTSNSNQGFIQALIYIGKTLQQHPSIEIISLRHRDSKLEVKLQANDVGLLNQFQQSLEKSALTMRVRTGTRDSTNDGFSSIITMEQL